MNRVTTLLYFTSAFALLGGIGVFAYKVAEKWTTTDTAIMGLVFVAVVSAVSTPLSILAFFAFFRRYAGRESAPRPQPQPQIIDATAAYGQIGQGTGTALIPYTDSGRIESALYAER